MNTRYIVLVASCICALSANAQTDSIQADTAAVQLKEVVVKANKVRVFADHDEMTLSDENKSFGANAVDAISSLPAFRTQINASEIVNLKNEKVTVIINKQVVSGSQLATYMGKEIKAVKYYPFTPGQYQAYCSGPVVEVELQKPRDAYVNLRLHEGILFESRKHKPLDFASNNNSAAFNYMDSLNMLRVNYSFDYMHQANMASTITNNYNDVHSQYSSHSGKRVQQNHNLFANYQYNTPTNLFSVIFAYGKMPYSRSKMPMRQTIDGVVIEDARVTWGDMNKESAKGAFFYDHTFANKGRLSIDAQGSVSWADSRDSLRMLGSDDNVFRSLNHDNSRVVSGNFSAVYSQPLWKGHLTAIGYGRINRIHKSFNGERLPDGTYMSLNIHTNYSMNIKNLSISLSLAYTYYQNKLSDGKKMAHHLPLPAINLGYKLNDRIRINASGSMGTSYRTIGSMYDTKYYDSENYYQEGNFKVKVCHRYYASAGISYYSPDGKLSLGANASYQYNTYPIYQFILKRGDDFVQTSLNSKNETSVGGGAYANYKVFTWLEAYASIRMNHYKNPVGPLNGNRFTKHNQLSFIVQLTAQHRNFAVSAQCNSRRKHYQGDGITDYPLEAQVSAGWRYRNLYASLYWYYNPSHTKKTMKADGFLWEQFSPNYTRNAFGLSLSYTFSHGVYKQKERKNISVGGDSGLLRE